MRAHEATGAGLEPEDDAAAADHGRVTAASAAAGHSVGARAGGGSRVGRVAPATVADPHSRRQGAGVGYSAGAQVEVAGTFFAVVDSRGDICADPCAVERSRAGDVEEA